MYNKISIIILILFSISLYSGTGFCAIGVPSTIGTCTAAQVEKFEVTLTKAEISQNNGVTWTTVFTGTKTLNIASANAGASAGSFFSDVHISEGTITDMRVTMTSSFIIRGYVAHPSNGNTYRSASGSNQPAVVGSTGAQDATVFLDENQDGTPDVASYLQTKSVNIPLASGQAARIKIIFNMVNALGLLDAGPNFMMVPKEVEPAIEAI